MQIIQFFLAISLMVVIHEFGHYLAGKPAGEVVVSAKWGVEEDLWIPVFM